MNVRQYNITIKCVLAILLSALFASCKDEDEEYKELSSGKNGEIGFNAFQDGFQKPTTRAVIDNVGDINEIYVLSMKKKGNSSWEQVFKNGAGADIDVLTLSNSGTSVWNYSPEENWEDGYNYKFRAYFPNTFNTSAGESCANGFQHSAISTGSTILTLNNYRSATDPRNNTDLLVSPTIDRPYATDKNSSVVSLGVKHLLACVDFRIKTKKGEKLHISKFTVHGYTREGSCVVNENPVWAPVWNETPKITSGSTQTVAFTYNGNLGEVTVDQDKFVFVDKTNNLEISTKDLLEKYLTVYGNYYNYYVFLKSEYDSASESLGPAETDGSKEEVDYYKIDNYEGLLFIPQELDRDGVVFGINYNVTRPDWGNGKDTRVKNSSEVVLKHLTFAEIEFYFGDEAPDKPLTAIVDLTANGKVRKWEAGTKYTYTIGMYEYQATANITIEDWQTHTYEEELK